VNAQTRNPRGRTGRRIAPLAVLATGLGSAAIALAPAAQAATTQYFSFTGGEQTVTVPAGVTTIHVLAVGGHGGQSSSADGGFGAVVEADLDVTRDRPCSSTSAATAPPVRSVARLQAVSTVAVQAPPGHPEAAVPRTCELCRTPTAMPSEPACWWLVGEGAPAPRTPAARVPRSARPERDAPTSRIWVVAGEAARPQNWGAPEAGVSLTS
jgi:hypothetical protein